VERADLPRSPCRSYGKDRMTAHNIGPLYAYRGEKLPLYRIGLLSGVPCGTLSNRLRRGMTLEQAISAPDQRKRHQRQINQQKEKA
jgi:hypothetical protein